METMFYLSVKLDECTPPIVDELKVYWRELQWRLKEDKTLALKAFEERFDDFPSENGASVASTNSHPGGQYEAKHAEGAQHHGVCVMPCTAWRSGDFCAAFRTRARRIFATASWDCVSKSNTNMSGWISAWSGISGRITGAMVSIKMMSISSPLLVAKEPASSDKIRVRSLISFDTVIKIESELMPKVWVCAMDIVWLVLRSSDVETIHLRDPKRGKSQTWGSARHKLMQDDERQTHCFYQVFQVAADHLKRTRIPKFTSSPKYSLTLVSWYHVLEKSCLQNLHNCRKVQTRNKTTVQTVTVMLKTYLFMGWERSYCHNRPPVGIQITCDEISNAKYLCLTACKVHKCNTLLKTRGFLKFTNNASQTPKLNVKGDNTFRTIVPSTFLVCEEHLVVVAGSKVRLK